jgi:DNA invertase Pin-like site-specific DNA recombinase
MASDLVTPDHLRRRAIVYIRQSTPHQVTSNQESLRLQYALQRRARDLGWREADVEVIDADLGLSGAAASHRQGFKDLVARTTLGEVGLILSIEVTRLARNCSDWYPLLDVCAHRGCLIADRDGIYDPSTPNGRLLLGLKGTISELELHTIRGRLTAGLLAKAERGELALQLPAGLTRDPVGVVVKDPNREVQERIAFIFDSFLHLRTAVKVTRSLIAHDLKLPRRDAFGEICWRRPTIPAVTTILRNPAYAGAFVYGRTCQRRGPQPSDKPQKSPLPRSAWRIVVKGKYPAYVSWDVYEKIQAMLQDNRAEYRRLKSRGIPRDGAALLHGIAWCGECGHKMVVRYKGGSQYVCNHLHQQYDAPVCQTLRAMAIDLEVTSAFLAAVAPAEIEAWRRASKAQHRADQAIRRAEEQQIERLRYQAALAERQFNRVDPDNRLVAAELEQRWEAALVELRNAEEALTRRETAAIKAEHERIGPGLRAKVIALGQKLPEIWADPATRRDHRKALLRCLIDKVVMRRIARDQASVRVIWKGGAASELTVKMPVNNLQALPRHAEMEARIMQLAHSGCYDDEIAGILTEEGHRSARHSTKVLPSTVQAVRLRHGLKLKSRQTRWTPVSDHLTVTEVAAKLQVSTNWIRGKIRRGAIETIKEPSGRYLFPKSEETLAALRQLRAGNIKHIDLTQHRRQNGGHQYA